MSIVDHCKFLWNGGLNPLRADPAVLRERRTLSSTGFFLIPLVIVLMISNVYTEGTRDNPYIALGLLTVVVCLYLQAYFNQQQLAANIGVMSLWLVVCEAMTGVGVTGTGWAWLLPIAPLATLLSGRVSGLIWTAIALATMWTFAVLQNSGVQFPQAIELSGYSPYFIAIEGSLILLMLSMGTQVFRGTQTRAEMRLRDAVKRLEIEVNERTLAETEARNSEAAKSAFLAAMSHEIRTPLNGMIGATQLLKDSSLPESKRELVDVILQCGDALVELTNNVLDLSSLESGNVELEEVPVNIRQLVKSSLAPMEIEIRKKGLTLQSSFSDDVPNFILGDPARLRQVFLNLVSNAVKFTQAGEVRVELDTAFDRLRIRITDTGVGIAKAAQASLFEPYVQADLSTSRKIGGSGLGLTIVKRLVIAMGGKIMVSSVPLQGSVFTIFLPYQASSASASVANSKAKLRGKMPNLNVLIADDNAVNRMVLTRLLEQDDHRVVAVSNGREAVEHLGNQSVDIVLMDLQMPVMDGIAATRRIRTYEGARGSVPIIAISAIVNRDNSEEVLKAGMNGFVTKPFHYEELLTVMQEALANQPKYRRMIRSQFDTN